MLQFICVCCLCLKCFSFFHNDLALLRFYANRNYCTRYSTLRNLCVPYIRTPHSRHPIDYLGAVLWNSMPFEKKDG